MGKSESLPAPRYTKTEEPFIPYVPDEKAVRERPTYAPALRKLAEVYMALGRQTDANAAMASLATITTTPATVAQSPDGYALFIAFVRTHENDTVALTEY